MTIATLRRLLYGAARLLGDAQAVRRRRVPQRVRNRVVGRIVGRLLAHTWRS